MCDFRDADELVPLLQIQQHGCRSQKCVPPARSFHFDHPVLNKKNGYEYSLSLPAVILLSFVLAVGFLMIILSCALWSNWLPLFVGSFYMFLSNLTPSLRFGSG